MYLYRRGDGVRKVDKTSPLPLYSQLMEILVEEIESGILLPGDQLLSERELCLRYDLSRSTVRLAIQEMERKGYLVKKHGKGTFVCDKKLKQSLITFYSFTDEMKRLGKVPSSKVLSFELLECDARTAKKLQIKTGEMVYRIERLRLADSEPMMLETTYLPQKRFKGLKRETLEVRPMYDVFNEVYHTDLTMAEESFMPVMVNDLEARHLQMSTTLPSLMIERQTFERDQVVEYTISITKGDCFKYTVQLRKG